VVQQWSIHKQKLNNRNAEFEAYEKAGNALFSQFPDVPDAYYYLLGLAKNAPTPQRARNLAANLLEKTAPAEVKAEAQAIIDRQDMVGRTFPLKFGVTNGAEFDLTKEKGRPVVIYFWANRGIETAAALPSLRAAATNAQIRFVGVNLDSSPMALVKAPDGNSPPGLQAWEPLGVAGTIPKQLHVAQMPSVYVFDASGVLRGFGPPRDLAAMIQALGK
jgi:hypothetical protein